MGRTAVAGVSGGLTGLLLVAIAASTGWAFASGHAYPLATKYGEWFGSLAATTVGVLLAFWLESLRKRREGVTRYAHTLASVLYDVDQLHAACAQILRIIAPGQIIIMALDAPALRHFASDRDLQEHGSHGLVTIVLSLVAVLDTTRNAMDLYRDAATFGGLTPQGQQDMKTRIEQLERGVGTARTFIARELSRLSYGMVRSADDIAAIEAFKDAIKATAPAPTTPVAPTPPAAAPGTPTAPP
jgi:hypothetical protein